MPETNPDATGDFPHSRDKLSHDQKLDTVRETENLQNAGGHHRLDFRSLRPFLGRDAPRSHEESRARYRRVSGRNQLAGKVVSLRVVGLLAEVVLAVEDAKVTAIVTAEAVREMGLRKGDSAAALIKSMNVMIERLDD
ncbi:MAG TPA: TOBE domain-containing protein [Terracidiphilus sp.]|nr:TOBE domain-containing protein [Terracidiphilus sp.]